MITSIGSLGTNAVYNTNRFLSINPSREVPVDRTVVVWYANPSLFSSGNPTDGWNFHKCYDSQGNIYCTIGAVTDTRDFVEVGALGLLFVGTILHALDETDTITVESHDLFSGNNWARAMSVEEFDFDTDAFGVPLRWATQSVNPPWPGVTDFGTDPSSISFSMSGDTRELLFLHLLSAEAPVTDTYTWDADYTQIVTAGTSLGGVTDNMTILGGYRIATLGSDTVNITSTTADRDYAQTMNGLCAVPQQIPFPISPILDDFNRANESPLDNGTWDTVNFAFGGAGASLVSNEAALAGGSFWLDAMEGCAEVYMDVPVFGGGPHLHFFGAGASEDANMEGRGLAWFDSSGSGGFVAGDWIEFGASGNQGRVGNKCFYAWVDHADDVKVGMQRTAGIDGAMGIDHLWIDLGGGWFDVGAVFVMLNDNGGSAHFSGKLALGLENNTTRADNFGGGEFVCPMRRSLPQIMRYR